jgi:hypothetical protein
MYEYHRFAHVHTYMHTTYGACTHTAIYTHARAQSFSYILAVHFLSPRLVHSRHTRVTTFASRIAYLHTFIHMHTAYGACTQTVILRLICTHARTQPFSYILATTCLFKLQVVVGMALQYSLDAGLVVMVKKILGPVRAN